MDKFWNMLKKYAGLIFDRVFKNRVTSIMGMFIILYAILYVPEFEYKIAIIGAGSALMMFKDSF
jgi:hypothetical protein